MFPSKKSNNSHTHNQTLSSEERQKLLNSFINKEFNQSFALANTNQSAKKKKKQSNLTHDAKAISSSSSRPRSQLTMTNYPHSNVNNTYSLILSGGLSGSSQTKPIK